jgi:transcriptional regulator with GAF, ATPase, and Fis domain
MCPVDEKKLCNIFLTRTVMNKSRKTADSVIFNVVDSAAFDVAKKKGMKETVQLFEAALIARAVEEGEGNYSAAARILQTPVTTLGSRKDVLEGFVKKMERKLKKRM